MARKFSGDDVYKAEKRRPISGGVRHCCFGKAVKFKRIPVNEWGPDSRGESRVRLAGAYQIWMGTKQRC
jgi:hypothetical protein